MQPFILRIILILPFLWLSELHTQPQITTFSKENGLTSQLINTTLVDSKGIVWAGSANGLNAYTGSKWYAIKSIEKKNSRSLQPIGKVHLLHEDRQQNIWVASDQGLFLYNRNFWTFFQHEDDEEYTIKEFFEDRSGNVWVTLEYFKDYTSNLGFSMVSGKLQCYMNNRWYKFDEDVAGTAKLKSYSPEKYFTDILQDRQGNVWFTTLEGIFVFDGKDWRSYKEAELKATETYSILEDSKGTIWVGTENGVLRQDDSDEWVHFRKKDGLNDHNIYRIEQDMAGRIWAWSRNDLRFTGLNLYENDSWHSYDSKASHLKGEIEKLISINDTLIAFSKYGVSKFTTAEWTCFDENYGLKDKRYALMFFDRKKTIWLAAETGLYSYNDSIWDMVFDVEKKWTVTKIYTDKQGRVWVGTSGSGLYLFEKGKVSHFDELEGISDGSITEIFEDKRGNTWVITKKGITKFDWSPANN